MSIALATRERRSYLDGIVLLLRNALLESVVLYIIGNTTIRARQTINPLGIERLSVIAAY